MKPELLLLVWAVALTLAQAVVAVQGALMQVGLVTLAGKTNAMTLLGAQIFLGARIVYAFVYLIGMPWVRTAIWTVSVVGLAMIFVQLI